MKLSPIMVGVITAISMSLSFSLPASSMDEPEFTISRMVISEKIVEKEPAAVADTFSADTEKVFCFLEATAIEHDTTVSFVWYFEGREMTRVSLPLSKGMRWRTYSSKKLAGLKGDWHVELLESSGIVLNSVSFKVE